MYTLQCIFNGNILACTHMCVHMYVNLGLSNFTTCAIHVFITVKRLNTTKIP